MMMSTLSKKTKKSESVSDNEVETVEKGKKILANLEQMRLHVEEAWKMREFCKKKNKIVNGSKTFTLEKTSNHKISIYLIQAMSNQSINATFHQ